MFSSHVRWWVCPKSLSHTTCFLGPFSVLLVSVHIIWEAEAKMGLDVQDIYWEKGLWGERGENTEVRGTIRPQCRRDPTLWRRKGRGRGEGRVSGMSECGVLGKFQLGQWWDIHPHCPSEEFCVLQEWASHNMPAMPGHQLRPAHAKYGVGMSVRLAPQGQLFRSHLSGISFGSDWGSPGVDDWWRSPKENL